MGRIILNGKPFQEEQVDDNKQTRTVWMFPLKLIDSPKVKIDLDIEDDIDTGEDEIETNIVEDDIDKRVSVEEPPPKGKRVPPKLPSFKGRKIDFNKKNKNRKIIGDKREFFVLEHEKDKLIKIGREDLANHIEHISKTQGDGNGYDIKSYDKDGNEIFIEVKLQLG